MALFRGEGGSGGEDCGKPGDERFEQAGGAVKTGTGRAAIVGEVAATVDLDLQRVDIGLWLAVVLNYVTAGVRRVERDGPTIRSGDAGGGGGDVGRGAGSMAVADDHLGLAAAGRH